MKKILFITLLAISFISGKSQQKLYHFWFIESDKRVVNTVLTNVISIDRVDSDTIYAYANAKEMAQFEKLGYKFTILPDLVSNSKTITMATSVGQMSTWDKYPTYEVYRAMMKKFEQDYPLLCKLDSVGTTPNGHKIYVVKLSNNVSIEEPEVEVFYTSTIHGDETTGFVLMLRLIDYFLSNYGIDTRTTAMMNNMAIYINPDANPDGTYHGGNSTVAGAIRYNSNYDDINRSFPDPRTGVPTTIIPEVQIMMDYANTKHFTLSANFHGGAELVNYPWDTWTSASKTHADDNWFIHFSRQYADSAHANSPAGYLTEENNGITNGGDWYVITGGRQDYMNWWHHCREVTIEISDTKTPSSDQLPNFWTYNRGAFLSYVESARQGFYGVVKNTSGDPVKAKVFITSHDRDSSYVYSNQSTGFYARPIEPGTWEVTYSSIGYIPQKHNITISNWNTSINQNITLIPAHKVTFDVKYQSVSMENVNVNFNGKSKITFSDGTISFDSIPEGGLYDYSISMSGYHSISGQLNVNGNKTIYINLVPETATVNSVSFNVTHLSTNISNATVIINGQEQQTSTVGTQIFSTIPQGFEYDYTISKAGYHSIIAQVNVVKDTLINIDLIPYTYNATFVVKHLGVPVPDVNIDFNSLVKLTDSYGEAVFEGMGYATNLEYTISKAGYISINGSVNLTNDLNVEVELIPQFDVVFNINSKGLPVENAKIRFNSLNKFTNQDGTVTFNSVMYGSSYSYLISKIGYNSVLGQEDITASKSIDINLSLVDVNTPKLEEKLIKVYPNPFSEYANIQFELEKPSFIELSVYSIDGKKVKIIAEGQYPTGLNSFKWIPSQAQSNGCYIVVLLVDGKTKSQIIQHSR